MPRLLAILVVLVLPILCLADGKMFASEVVVSEPSIQRQRALVSWHDGQQTLVVENVVRADGEAAWLLPVPGKPTQIEQLPEGFFTLLSVRYVVPVIQAGMGIPLAIYVLLLVVGGMALARSRSRKEPLTPTHYILTCGLMLCIGGTVCGILFPVFAGSSSDSAIGHDFQFKTVGSYEVSVISPDQTDAGIAWLREHKFRVSAKEQAVLEDYAKKGWHLVASRLKAGSDASKPLPLLIRCLSSEAVYPMALTALQGGPLNLELFAVGPGTAQVSGMKLALSRKTQDAFESEKQTVFPAESWTTRLNGTYNLDDHREDIRIKWGARSMQSMEMWTSDAKWAGLMERVLFGLCFGLVLITPFFMKSDPFRLSAWKGAGIGAALGLIFTIPIWLAPSIPGGGAKVWRPGILSQVRDDHSMAGLLSAETTRKSADKEWEEHRRHRREMSSMPLLYLTYTPDETGAKMVSLDVNGEPIYKEARWK